MQLTAATVAAAAGGALIAGNPALEIDGFSIDSRTLNRGDLFLAIRGERFDGHRFVAAAFDRGAVGVIVDDVSAVAGMRPGAVAIVVKDTVRGFKRWRNAFDVSRGRRLPRLLEARGRRPRKRQRPHFSRASMRCFATGAI
jgi:UDP-N-acetylmuramoyl-tripeptide--D-alanyl-D-alanine ligase